jgi:F like protein
MSQSARSPSVPMLERPAARRSVSEIRLKVGLALAEIRRATMQSIQRRSLGWIAAAADDEPVNLADDIADNLDLTPLTKAGLGVEGALSAAGREAGTAATDLVDRKRYADTIANVSSDLARDRAAEMVGMKRDDDGKLVENPDAKWSITESTRAMVRDTIADGLERGATTSEIASDIANSTALSDDRAELIARTEVASINNDVALAAYKTIDADAESGIKLRKSWLLGSDPCPVCAANAAAGDIGLDEDFPSGDDAPPLHPNCECEVEAVEDDSDSTRSGTESDDDDS